MVRSLFPLSWVARALLAALLTACGGGGGGDPVVVTPPLIVDREGPKAVAVTPDGMKDVPVSGTQVVAVYNEAIACDGITGSMVQLGTVPATLACDGAAKRLTATPTAPLPYGSVVSTTLPAVSDTLGNPGAAVPVAFTTEPAPDTTAPKFLTASPTNGATDVERQLRSVIVSYDDTVQCTGATATLTGGGLTVPVAFSCTGRDVTLNITAEVPQMFQKTTHTWTVTGVTDTLGNPSAAAMGRFTTRAIEGVGTRLYTANYGAKQSNGGQSMSAVDLTNGGVTHITPAGAWSTQSLMVVDSRMGRAYSSGAFVTYRGIDVIDIGTGAVSSFQIVPDPAMSEESPSALALGPTGLYVGYANVPWDPDFRNQVLRFDRLTNALVAKSAPLSSGTLTPTAVIVHPDPAVKRVYALSSDVKAMGAYDYSCGGIWDYQPGTTGLVTELHSETLEVIRTFVVGSVPMAGVVDVVHNRLIVGEGGDRGFSVIDLGPGIVTKVDRPTSLTKCRQAQEGSMLLDTAGRLWMTNTYDGVHVFDSGFNEVAFISTGFESAPRGIVPVGDKLYVALSGSTSGNVVAEIVGTSVARTIVVGPNPYAIGAYVPLP